MKEHTLNGNQLKIVAMLAMTIDHLANGTIITIFKKMEVFIMTERITGLDNLLEELNGNILGKSDNTKYVGIATITRRDLEKLKASNHKAKIKMVGTLTFSEDVTPELARETIESVKVRGTIKASHEVQGVLDTLINVKR